MLVDDEEMILDVEKQMLKRIGYRVITAQSAKKDWNYIKLHKEEIHLVILDIDYGRNERAGSL